MSEEKKEAVEAGDPVKSTETAAAAETAETKEPPKCEACGGNGKKPCICKRILKGAAWTLGVIVLLLCVLILALDPIVETVVRSIGSRATGTKVEIRNFSSSLFSARVSIDDLSVGNPEGYHNPVALEFTSFLVKLDPSSLTTDTVVVEEIIIDGLKVDFEAQGGISVGALLSGDFSNIFNAESNLTRILNNVNAFAGTSEGEDGTLHEEAPPAGKEEAPAKKVVIKHLLVQNSTISFSSSLLKTTLNIPLPNYEMNNTSESSLAVAISDFFNTLYRNIVIAVVDYAKTHGATILNSLGEGISAGVDAVNSGVSAGVDAVSSSVSAGVDAVSSGIDKLGEGINSGVDSVKGLFQ